VVTLVNRDLEGIIGAHSLSRVTMRNIKQNLVPSSPMRLECPSLDMSSSSVSVVSNALRLRRVGL
jgi:cation transport ATPase